MAAAPDAPLVLSVFSTFAVGGAQVRFAAVMNRIGARLRHLVVAMDGDTSCADRLDPSLDVEFAHVRIEKRETGSSLLRYRAYMAERRPALVITHNWGTIEWAMARLFTGIAHIHIADGFGPEERSTQIARRVWTRRLVLRTSTVVVPSRTLERIARESWMIPDVRYIPNGIDLAHLGAPAAGAHEVPVIGTIAALRPEKNLARLLRACARVTLPFRLVIAGDGPERAGLERLAGELGLAERVHFPGWVADPARLCAELDIVAMSSDTEQMPLCVLEGMAARLPVVATDVGDIAAMVAEENRAFIVEQREEALAAALTRLLESPALRARVGAANRRRAEAEFDQETMFRAYEALLLPGR